MVFNKKKFVDEFTLTLVDQYQRQRAMHKPESPESAGKSAKSPALSLYHIREDHILFSDYARHVLKRLNETGITEGIDPKFASTLDSIVTRMTTGIKDVDGIDISNNKIRIKENTSITYGKTGEISGKTIINTIHNALPQACADAYAEMTRKPEPKIIIHADKFATLFLSYIEQEIELRKDETLRLAYGPCDEHDSFDKNYGRFITNLEKQLKDRARLQIDEFALVKELKTAPIMKKDGKLYFNEPIDESSDTSEKPVRTAKCLEGMIADKTVKTIAINTRDHFLGLKKDLEDEKKKKIKKRE